MPQAGEEARTQADFYRNLPLFHSFDRLMDPALDAPLPDGLDLEARAGRRGPLLLRTAQLLGFTLFADLITRFESER